MKLLNFPSDVVFIHYGSNWFDITRWESIKNRWSEKDLTPYFKPSGGLWASIHVIDNSWIEFLTRAQNFNYLLDKDSVKRFTFQLSGEARIIRIYSDNDLFELFNNHEYEKPLIDWIKLKQEYDGIFFSRDFVFKTQYYKLNIDCESILIFNENIIKTRG